MTDEDKKIALFDGKNIRKIFHNREWWFSVVDVIQVLTDSLDGGAYWRKFKQRLSNEGSEVVTFCHGLKLISSDGKKYSTDCANTEGLFRIIQSVPSPRAEPLKLWLAKVAYERVQEIEDPELVQNRMKAIYEQKGYPKDWIEKRLQSMAIRQDLTEEWRERGINDNSDFAILTSEISKATFGMTPTTYKKFKKIPEKSKANLRDNMTSLELIFTMLGEKVTTEISKQEKPDTFPENIKVAGRGGKVAGNARKETENELGKSIISPKNCLDIKKLK